LRDQGIDEFDGNLLLSAIHLGEPAKAFEQTKVLNLGRFVLSIGRRKEGDRP
jgi:hypothetical protein